MSPGCWRSCGILALAIVIGWTMISRNRKPKTDRPLLTQRAETYVGHEGQIDEPIVNGFGRMRLGDTVWRIAGPDLAAGQRVRVVGAEGAVLKVEAA